MKRLAILLVACLASGGIRADNPRETARSSVPTVATVVAATVANEAEYSKWVDGDGKPIVDRLKAGGFTDTDLSGWAQFVESNYGHDDQTDRYTVDPDNLVAWKNTGLAPGLASQLISYELDDPDSASKAAPLFAKKCHEKIYDLDKVNPYAVAGKCFVIKAFSVIQLLGANDALTSNENLEEQVASMGVLGQLAADQFKEHIVLLHYPQAAPDVDSVVYVLAIGVGAYKYTATSGALTTAAKMRVLVNLKGDSN